MNHFNLKSLIFYGVAISSVLLLFKAVTAYGESNLKAPPSIDGRYHIDLGEKLPNCDNSQVLILNIQQSGIYLNGFLSPVNINAKKKNVASGTHPSLIGKLNNQKLTLSGQVSKSFFCNIINPKTQANANLDQNSLNSINLQMQQADKESFTGQITVSGISKPIGFTAILQKSQEKSEN